MSVHIIEEGQKLAQSELQNEQNEEILPGYTTIEEFTKDGYKIFMEAIRNSNSLPNGRDWNFYSIHDSFTKIVNKQGNTVLKQINSILHKNEIEGNIRNRALEEKTELMIEANDVILERVANNIDEMNGIKKTVTEPNLVQTVSAHLPVNGSWNRINNTTFSVSSSITSEPSKNSGTTIRLLTARNIIRPQKFFKDSVVNSSQYPWEPRIKEKPNSLKPLAIFLEETENGHEYSHPYEYELERFTPLPEQLKREVPLKPREIKDTPLIEINLPGQVDELVETLRNCKEFAVDVEHHSYRTFMGITCLMQISTREKDYLIDTLALRDKLYILNEVFTKPSIVKIFHGADMDIKWLQRDLSVYVVNMFDTHLAAKQLGYSGLSLSYLMQRFCNFVPNKLFQLADWRIRPLPDELKAYAREDTHYLIYIYQMLKNELLDRANGQDNILLSVINSSTKICQKRYFKPVLREDSHLDFYRKCKRLFDNRQLYALKELYKWRDQIAREEDESTGYVLPNHMLLQISESLPREMQGILACCNPIPPLVRTNLLELHQMILRAKEQSLEKPILKEDTRARGTTLKISKINVDSPLHCPHDLTKINEFRDDLPTLLDNRALGNQNLVNKTLDIESSRSIYSIFQTPENSDDEDADKGLKKHNFVFLGPFERYKLVKPFIQAEEQKLTAEQLQTEDKIKDSAQSSIGTRQEIPTDEERIESIREHFLKLSRLPVPEAQERSSDETSISVKGTKKRKREQSPEIESNSMLELDLQININAEAEKSLKRKSSDLPNNDGSPSKAAKFDGKPLSKQKRKFNKNKNFDCNQEPNIIQKLYQNSIQKSNHNKKKQKRKHWQQGQHPKGSEGQANQCADGVNVDQSSSSINVQITSNQHDSVVIKNGSGINNKQKRGKKFRGEYQGKKGKGQKYKPKTHGQPIVPENQNFAAFDYSSVDFRQFQGGAGGMQRPQEFKSTFKFKGKKKGGNRGNHNRSSTFGNNQRGGKRNH